MSRYIICRSSECGCSRVAIRMKLKWSHEDDRRRHNMLVLTSSKFSTTDKQEASDVWRCHFMEQRFKNFTLAYHIKTGLPCTWPIDHKLAYRKSRCWAEQYRSAPVLTQKICTLFWNLHASRSYGFGPRGNIIGLLEHSLYRILIHIWWAYWSGSGQNIEENYIIVVVSFTCKFQFTCVRDPKDERMQRPSYIISGLSALAHFETQEPLFMLSNCNANESGNDS